MKKFLFILIIVHCTMEIDSGLSGNCQVQQWVARYNGPGNNYDDANSIAVDGSGNVYITGSSRSGAVAGTEDYATIKYNSSGVQQWAARYNGQGNNTDEANSIAVDGSGNTYVTGRSFGSGTDYDYVTMKYNSAGVQQWLHRYNGPGNADDAASSIAVDGSGNVYVTGRSYGGSGTDYDYATIKYNSAGVQQWLYRYNGPANADDAASSIAVDGSGNVYVTGKSIGNGEFYNYATIKLNSAGIVQWVRRYNGPGNDIDAAFSIAVDGSGNVYVTGQSTGSGTNYDYATIKYNSSGVQQWLQRYNGPGNSFDVANAIAVDGSGNVYVTGESRGNGTGYDYATIKYNSSGVQQWLQRYNGPPGNDWDNATSMALDGSDNVYVTGYSYGSGTNFDYATIKYNPSGVQQWLLRYNGSGNSADYTSSIKVDASGNVYVTGESWGSGTYFDYTTIKYSQPVGITPVSNQIPETFRLYQNYPNPFNPATRIKFDIPANLKSEICNLKLFDILGREAAVLVSEELKAGTYEIEFNASSYPSGIYYYTLTAGEFQETRKAVFVK